jgi:SEC-C motif domain protein
VTIARCPCLSGQTYDECCGRLHRGDVPASSAEALMRSRFSAFAVGDAGYLRRTWHPTTCPQVLTLDDDVRWYRLDILATSGGGELDTAATVEFRAFFRAPGGAGSQHEVSRFVRAGGQWFYLDGVA